MPKVILRSLVENARDQIVSFAQQLLRTLSVSGQEEALAELVLSGMRALGYDRAWIDQAGNVIGRLEGGPGPSTMLHSHMDVVDPGEYSRWSHAPFSGDIADGCLWGRGASDDKGCLVAQVYALGLLKQAGLRPAGDVYLAAVVNEETGGLGTQYLLGAIRGEPGSRSDWLPKPDVAIIGEPSGNTLRRAHRGRLEFIVIMRGRSAHASAPERGLNPHFSMARFLLTLHEAPMAKDPLFGGSSVSPTLAYVDQTSSNVIPFEAAIHLDWRSVPGETRSDAQALLQRLAAESVEPGIQASIDVRSQLVRTYTGLQETVRHDLASFCLDLNDPILVSAHAILEEALDRAVGIDVWAFCTDGGYLASAGIPCIGFGPGEEEMAHVVDERLEIDQLLEATAGYMALALRMGEV